jgi:hypothetical protein
MLIEYPAGFAFILGMLILMEVGVHLRHFRSYFMLAQIKSMGGLEGKLYYRRWFIFSNSAFEFFSLAIVFLLTALLTRSLFFTGGAVACLSLTLNHYRHYRRLYKQSSIAPANPADSGKSH